MTDGSSPQPKVRAGWRPSSGACPNRRPAVKAGKRLLVPGSMLEAASGRLREAGNRLASRIEAPASSHRVHRLGRFPEGFGAFRTSV